MSRYAVITADIINSKLAERFAAKLKPVFSQLHFPSLLTPFALSRGDEIQAVCNEPATLPQLIRELRYHCLPFQIRVGVGIGSIEAVDHTLNSWEMNGEAFFRAREALDSFAKDKFPGTRFCTSESFFDLALNTIYLLNDTYLARWTDAQWEAIHYYQLYRTYQKAAEVLKIARQNVQKRCYAAHWHEINLTEQNVKQLLSERYPIFHPREGVLEK